MDTEEKKAEIMRAMHDELGYKGRESTYGRIATRYYWETLYADVKLYVQQCGECQYRAPDRQDEALTSTAPVGLFVKIHLDIVEMPHENGKRYLVVARDDFSWWPEARALSRKMSAKVAEFI